jgi:hypothetical protein
VVRWLWWGSCGGEVVTMGGECGHAISLAPHPPAPPRPASVPAALLSTGHQQLKAIFRLRITRF